MRLFVIIEVETGIVRAVLWGPTLPEPSQFALDANAHRAIEFPRSAWQSWFGDPGYATSRLAGARLAIGAGGEVVAFAPATPPEREQVGLALPDMESDPPKHWDLACDSAGAAITYDMGTFHPAALRYGSFFLRSGNGSYWRLRCDSAGAIVTEALTGSTPWSRWIERPLVWQDDTTNLRWRVEVDDGGALLTTEEGVSRIE